MRYFSFCYVGFITHILNTSIYQLTLTKIVNLKQVDAKDIMVSCRIHTELCIQCIWISTLPRSWNRNRACVHVLYTPMASRSVLTCTLFLHDIPHDKTWQLCSRNITYIIIYVFWHFVVSVTLNNIIMKFTFFW